MRVCVVFREPFEVTTDRNGLRLVSGPPQVESVLEYLLQFINVSIFVQGNRRLVVPDLPGGDDPWRQVRKTKSEIIKRAGYQLQRLAVGLVETPQGERTPVSKLTELSPSIRQALAKAGYRTLGRLTAATEEELVAVTGIGRSRLGAIVTALTERGYCLAG